MAFLQFSIFIHLFKRGCSGLDSALRFSPFGLPSGNPNLLAQVVDRRIGLILSNPEHERRMIHGGALVSTGSLNRKLHAEGRLAS